MGNVIKSLSFSNGRLSWNINFLDIGRNFIKIQIVFPETIYTAPLILQDSDMLICIDMLNSLLWKTNITVPMIEKIVVGAASFSTKRYF